MPIRRALPALAAVALLAGACSTSGDAVDDAATEAADPAAEEFESSADDGADRDLAGEQSIAADQPAEGEAADSAGGATPGADGTDVAATAGRQIVYTATVALEVDDVASATADVVAAVEGVGGFVFGQDVSGGAEPRAEIVFKVAPDDFDRALDALGGVGELRNQTVSADDVTERVVDLESRIATMEAGIERLREALAGAVTLEDYAELERRLLDRETELELLRGRLRTLADQVELATITVVLAQDRVENALQLTTTAYGEHDEGLGCPGSDRPEVVAGDPLTVCFEVVNLGDQTLVDVVLTDAALGIDSADDLVVVFGSFDEPLPPGGSLVAAVELEPERTVRPNTRVTATPTDGVDDEPSGPPVNTTGRTVFPVERAETGPGFGDGFDAGVAILAAVWSALVVAAGFAVPLLVFAPIVIGGWWLARRAARRRAERRRERAAVTMPPPPGPTNDQSIGSGAGDPAAGNDG